MVLWPQRRERPGQGRWRFPIANGHARNRDAIPTAAAIHAATGRAAVRFGTEHRDGLEAILDRNGVARPERVSPTRQLGMACPAIPTCGLAISESERTLPGIIDALETELAQLGLTNERIGVRMTGCPNGCARPYQSEVGIVGRSGNKYVLYIGGSSLGDRLNIELKDLVPAEEIVPTLRVVLEAFRDGRRPNETFGGYCQRVGIESLRRLVGAEHARSA